MQSLLLLVLASSLMTSTFAWNVRFPLVDRENNYRWPIDLQPVKRSRPCFINAGLSQGCDLSDIIMAKQQASKFMSFAGPGRR